MFCKLLYSLCYQGMNLVSFPLQNYQMSQMSCLVGYLKTMSSTKEQGIVINLILSRYKHICQENQVFLPTYVISSLDLIFIQLCFLKGDV